MVKYRKYIDYQVSILGTVQTQLVARLRERLTRKTGAEYIMRGNAIWFDQSDISKRFNAVVLFVKASKLIICLTGEHTLVAEGGKRGMEAA